MAAAIVPGSRRAALCGTVAILLTVLLVSPMPAAGYQVDPEMPIGEDPSQEMGMDSLSVADSLAASAKTIPLYHLGVFVGEIVADDKAVYLGGTLCIRFLPKVRTGLFLSFDIRTGEQAVREGIRDNYFIQRKELVAT